MIINRLTKCSGCSLFVSSLALWKIRLLCSSSFSAGKSAFNKLGDVDGLTGIASMMEHSEYLSVKVFVNYHIQSRK